jgi:hypothetical protein
MTPDQFLARYRTRCFFHFTDTRNLPLIRASGGLLRLAEARRRGIAIPAPGGNDWSHEADARVGLDEYVHLCLFAEHPMEYRAREEGRIVQSTFLEISPEVLNIDGLRFTADVSNKRGVELLTLELACQVMDFAVVYDRTNWRDPTIQERRKMARRYEVLVPADIPLKLISGL